MSLENLTHTKKLPEAVEHEFDLFVKKVCEKLKADDRCILAGPLMEHIKDLKFFAEWVLDEHFKREGKCNCGACRKATEILRMGSGRTK